MTKFCKFDERPSWPCRWQGEPTAEDCINCQLFAIKNTLYRLLRSFEEAAKQAAEELVKETEEAVGKLEGKKK